MDDTETRYWRKWPWGPLALAGLAAVAIGWTEPELANLRAPTSHPAETALPTAPREITQALALGFRNVLADYYWLSAIQYYGTPRNQKNHMDGLYPLVDLVTDLDPHFEYAYQFGGETIPFHDPDTGDWYNTRDAIRLLRKALPDHPSRWEIPWLLGYTLYAYWGEYREAGQAMLVAAALADSIRQRSDAMFAPPTYLRSMADRLLAQGNNVETAIDTTRFAIASAADPDVIRELQERLQALLLQKQLADLNAATQRARAQGETFTSIPELVRLQGASLPAVDPYGDAFFLGPDGVVRSKNESKLLRISVHPGQSAIEHAVD